MKEWPSRCSDYFMDEIRKNKFETIKIWRISSNLPRCCNSSVVRPKAMLGLVWPYEIRRKYRNTYTASNAFSSPVPLGLQRPRDHKETMCFRNENGKDVIQSWKSFLEPDRHLHTPKATFPFHLNYTKKKQNTLRPVTRIIHRYPLSLITKWLLGMRRNSHQTLQGPVVRRPLTWRGLKFTSGFLFFWSKAFSRIIFSILFRASNYQIVDKKN